MAYTLEAVCKTCDEVVARAKNLSESEVDWHKERAPLVFRCNKGPSHNNGAFGDFTFKVSEEVVRGA